MALLFFVCDGQQLQASNGGLDALLSTVQMPSGVPVAAVAIDGAANAAWLAARILAVEDGALAAMLEERAEAMEREVAQKDAALRERLETEP